MSSSARCRNLDDGEVPDSSRVRVRDIMVVPEPCPVMWLCSMLRHSPRRS